MLAKDNLKLTISTSKVPEEPVSSYSPQQFLQQQTINATKMLNKILVEDYDS